MTKKFRENQFFILILTPEHIWKERLVRLCLNVLCNLVELRDWIPKGYSISWHTFTMSLKQLHWVPYIWATNLRNHLKTTRKIILVLLLSSRSAVSDALWPHGRQHARLPWPSYLLESTQTHVHWVGDAIQPSRPLSPSSPPALNLSQHQGLFWWVGTLHQVAKVSDLHLQHRPSSEWSGLISFRIDWLHLLAVQGTLQSLLQHHSSKASILQHSAFLYGPTLTFIPDHWKNHSFDCMDLCHQSDVSAF